MTRTKDPYENWTKASLLAEQKKLQKFVDRYQLIQQKLKEKRKNDDHQAGIWYQYDFSSTNPTLVYNNGINST